MVHDKVVWGIVQHNWNDTKIDSNTRKGYIERLQVAWLRILTQRQTRASAPNEDFAAAEHYAYARFFVAQCGDTKCIALATRIYDLIKTIAIDTGDEKKIRTFDKNYPPVPASGAIRSWADRGAKDGERDFHLLFPGQKPHTLEACEILADSAKGIVGPLVSYKPQESK
jgi:hypothetical protein